MLFLVPKQQRKSNDGKVTPAETAKQKWACLSLSVTAQQKAVN